MLDDLSANNIKETGDVVAGLLRQIGLIGIIALIGSFLGVCLLSTALITGILNLEIYILFSTLVISPYTAVVYLNWRKTKKEEDDDGRMKKHAEGKREKMTRLDWIKTLFAIILFMGIICGLWAAIMLIRTDVDFGRPELLENPSYKGTMILSGIMGLTMIFLFIIASLIISHKEEEAKRKLQRVEEG